jgi:hypothetical protein
MTLRISTKMSEEDRMRAIAQHHDAIKGLALQSLSEMETGVRKSKLAIPAHPEDLEEEYDFYHKHGVTSLPWRKGRPSRSKIQVKWAYIHLAHMYKGAPRTGLAGAKLWAQTLKILESSPGLAQMGKFSFMICLQKLFESYLKDSEGKTFKEGPTTQPPIYEDYIDQDPEDAEPIRLEASDSTDENFGRVEVEVISSTEEEESEDTDDSE